MQETGFEHRDLLPEGKRSTKSRGTLSYSCE